MSSLAPSLTPISPTKCPCGTDLLYAHCCQPLHNGAQFAKTAEQLMRSRYSAYVLQLIDYIVITTVPEQQPLLDHQAILDWARQTAWSSLEIVKHTPKIGKRHAQVEFKAYFTTDSGQQAHHELSTFVKIKNDQQEKWYFLDPTTHIKTTQKQPCLCGSGEKFKHCCGVFLG